MLIHNTGRSSRALLLAAVLVFASFPAFAAPRGSASRQSGDSGAFSAILETLRSAWLVVWGEEGMTIDPSGRPEGARMTNVVGSEGMSLDPSGRPAGTAPNPGETTDEGTSIDPHG